MREIEAKVRLSAKRMAQLKNELERKKAVFKGIQKKEDFYFLTEKKEQIRLRIQNGKSSFFNLKCRRLKNGIEENEEKEWPLNHPKAFLKTLEKLGIVPIAQKNKLTQLYAYKGFSLELNQVRGLGYFLEIETLLKKSDRAVEAHKKLLEIFKEFGFSKKDFEKKTYLELLQEEKAKKDC